MKRSTLLLLVVLLLCSVTWAQVMKGHGAPNVNTPNSADSRFYIDESTGKLYMSVQGSPPKWVDVDNPEFSSLAVGTTVTAQSFLGDGSKLTGINTSDPYSGLRPGLLAEWNLTAPNSDGSFSDLSGNSNTLTPAAGTNAPATSPYGLVFAGTQYATAPAINPASGQITVMLVIASTGTTTKGVIEHNSGSAGWTILETSSTAPAWYQFTTGASFPHLINSPVITGSNRFVSLAFTTTGAANKVYVDGALADSNSQSMAVNTDAGLTYLGTRSSSPATNGMTGTIAYVMVWGKALSASDIALAHTYISGKVPAIGLPSASLPALSINAVNPLPQMGWESWNYNAYVTDTQVKAQADALVTTGMKDSGYTYVNVDEIFSSRDGNGHVVPLNTWSGTVKQLADYVHSKGLKFGVYQSPGETTCIGYATGSYGHETTDANDFAAWGVDDLKYDWCSASAHYADTPIGVQTAFSKMALALRATGRPILYTLSDSRNEMWKYMAQSGANSSRVSPDVVNWTTVNAAFDLPWGVINQYSGPNHWADADMLICDKFSMTADECRTQFSFWSMMASPLMAGNDLTSMTAATLATLTNTEVIAVDQDSLVTPGFRASSVVCGSATCEVWARKLHDGWAIGFFNRDSSAHDIAATWSMVGQVGPFTGRSLWAHSDLGSLATGYTATAVPAHGVVMLKLTP